MSRWIARVRLMFRYVFRRNRIDEELDEEFRYHLERQIHEEMKGGLASNEARYAAIRAMGPIARSIEESRDVTRLKFVDDLLRDLKYAGRALRRNPAFAAIVLATLTIAIGTVVTVFSIVDAWLLRPLNFPQPERLVIAFVAQAVIQRRRELAIRIGLGERPSAVIATVSRRALTATITGFGLGIVAAVMLGHVIETLLYGVRSRDAASLVTAGAVLLAAATVAAVVPALRATRLDPAKVLGAD